MPSVRAVVREVGPYESSEVASSLVAWPACAAFGSRRLTLARERRTCIALPSSAPFSCASRDSSASLLRVSACSPSRPGRRWCGTVKSRPIGDVTK